MRPPALFGSFLVTAATALGIAWVQTGCGHSEAGVPPPGFVAGNGAEIESLQKVGAGCPSLKAAKLTLAGDAIPVEVGCTDSNGEIDVKLTAHSTVFEEEKYRQTDGRFELVDAAGETYEPPVILARAPMHIGDKWTWTGRMLAGDVGHPAKAAVTTSQERIYPPSGAVDALKIQVDFEIESGGPTPAKRSLSFWLAPGLGVVKRQFGSSSMREPAGP